MGIDYTKRPRRDNEERPMTRTDQWTPPTSAYPAPLDTPEPRDDFHNAPVSARTVIALGALAGALLALIVLTLMMRIL